VAPSRRGPMLSYLFLSTRGAALSKDSCSSAHEYIRVTVAFASLRSDFLLNKNFLAITEQTCLSQRISKWLILPAI
jgi:hypothetical protein